MGHYLIQYPEDKTPTKKPILGSRHCPDEAEHTVEHDGFTFYWCAKHAADPTFGIEKRGARK